MKKRPRPKADDDSDPTSGVQSTDQKTVRSSEARPKATRSGTSTRIVPVVSSLISSSTSSTTATSTPAVQTMTSKRSKQRDTRLLTASFNRLPDVIALHMIPSYLSLIDISASMCRIAKVFRNLNMEAIWTLQKQVLPHIGWVCDQKRIKKWNAKQLDEIRTNLMAGRVVCLCQRRINSERKRNYRRPEIDESGRKEQWKLFTRESEAAQKQNLPVTGGSVQTYGCICICKVRRFIPVIRKTVSGEDVILRNNEHCWCTGDRDTQHLHHHPYNYREPANASHYLWTVDSRRDDHGQFRQILEIVRFKLLDAKYDGLDNELIRAYLWRIQLLDLFRGLVSRVSTNADTVTPQPFDADHIKLVMAGMMTVDVGWYRDSANHIPGFGDPSALWSSDTLADVDREWKARIRLIADQIINKAVWHSLCPLALMGSCLCVRSSAVTQSANDPSVSAKNQVVIIANKSVVGWHRRRCHDDGIV